MPGTLVPIKSPIDGQIYHSAQSLSEAEAFARLGQAERAQRAFQTTTIAERSALCRGFLDAFEARRAESTRAITEMMGKPLAEADAEVSGMRARTEALISYAEAALADEVVEESPTRRRLIRHEPLGVVLNISAWNYPLLVLTNVVVPAVLSGNAVLIKHAPETALVGAQFEDAFRRAGAPDGLVRDFFVSHAVAKKVLTSGRLGHLAFTGSGASGNQVFALAASAGLIHAGLELGGKDAALVLSDADVAQAAKSLAEGAFYNAGQSCCAVERIYVPAHLHADFVEALVSETKRLVLGDPRDAATTLGPVVHEAAAARILAQAHDALARGAQALIAPSAFALPKASAAYVAPQVFQNVDHSMALMKEETFGPLIGVMAYKTEAEAIRLVNDSPYGLTASIWTADLNRAEQIGRNLQVGTVFANRADYVDPYLPWSGVKASGLGASLSRHGFFSLTRPKSYHLRVPPY